MFGCCFRTKFQDYLKLNFARLSSSITKFTRLKCQDMQFVSILLQCVIYNNLLNVFELCYVTLRSHIVRLALFLKRCHA